MVKEDRLINTIDHLTKAGFKCSETSYNNAICDLPMDSRIDINSEKDGVKTFLSITKEGKKMDYPAIVLKNKVDIVEYQTPTFLINNPSDRLLDSGDLHAIYKPREDSYLQAEINKYNIIEEKKSVGKKIVGHYINIIFRPHTLEKRLVDILYPNIKM